MNDASEPFDAADYLQTAEDVAAYLQAAFAEDDPALWAAAVGDAARARGLTGWKAQDDAPAFADVVKTLHAMGLALKLEPASMLPRA